MTIHMTFEQLRAAQPALSIDIIQRLGHEAGGIKPLVCDGIAGPRTKSGIYLDPQARVALACGVAYMLSGYFGLYSSQKILYSKLRTEFINIHAK